MHNCEEFRERITEHIIDREDLAANAEFQHELLICSKCSEFYAESRDMIDALSGVDLEMSEKQWAGVEQRWRARILAEPAVVASFRPPARNNARGYMVWAAVAALVLITVGLSRFAKPTVPVQRAAAPTSDTVFVDRAGALDPVTVDFLENSELLLRNVMKITPGDAEDVADVKKTASQQLAEIQQRKEAAAEVPPVVDVMAMYETVLRDLRNIDERTESEDIPDIQRRIQKNALIANMKAFQPTLTQVSFSLR